MKRMIVLALFAALPSSAPALADGCPASTCGTTSTTQPGARVIFVRPVGQQGPLEAYAVDTGAKRFALPRGVLSADGRRFVSAHWRKAARRTIVERFDAVTGMRLRRWSVPGRARAVGISANGRRIVLARPGRRGTTFLLYDGARPSTLSLRGTFEYEALSPDGRRVFLVHWKRSGGYTLEHYDRSAGRLRPTALDEPDEKMSGTAVTAVMRRDGAWLYTLYVKADGEAFVHALPLATGLAHCIDLPLRGDIATIGASALALSPDGRRLFVTSPFVGRMVTVDLVNLDVDRVERFTPPRTDQVAYGIGPSAAVTRNGRMLAVAADTRLWLFDTAYGTVRKAKLGYLLTGVGFRPNGRELVVLRPGGFAVFDAATARRVR